jgi:hypothetical protein
MQTCVCLRGWWEQGFRDGMEIPHPREAGDPVYSATSASLIPFLSLRHSHSFTQPDSFSLTHVDTGDTRRMQKQIRGANPEFARQANV